MKSHGAGNSPLGRAGYVSSPVIDEHGHALATPCTFAPVLATSLERGEKLDQVDDFASRHVSQQKFGHQRFRLRDQRFHVSGR